MDLFDGRVTAVSLVRGHGVDRGWVGGGEEAVEAPGVEQSVPPKDARFGSSNTGEVTRMPIVPVDLEF